MHFLSQVVDFFTTASNWSGSDGILVRFAHQAELSAAVVVAAAIAGAGLGGWLGHSGRAGFLAVNAANAARAVPSLALLTLLAIQPSIGLRRIEAPLSVPLVMAGVRTAAVEVVATATLAAYVSFSDLGTYVVAGLNTQDNVEAFCAAVLVAVLALGTALILPGAQRAVTPAG